MNNKETKLETLRHSLAHVLATAVLDMFPEAKFGTGPAVENGFYYDFDLPRTLIPEDLPLLEEKMKKIIEINCRFERAEISAENAIQKFEELGQNYKIELIKGLAQEGNKKITVYKTGGFVDLCSGPHLDSTGEINKNSFKLTRISGAYWRADEKNKQLQRIYGVAFETQAELEKYFDMITEAEKRDHKKLGKELELFLFHETAPGMPYWLPKGLIIFNELINFWRQEHSKRNYQEIKSPLINKKALYETSGHWEHYKKEMFICETDEQEVYALKPMNCPNAMVVYDSTMRSYRDLPLRLSDTDTLHRNELSGTLNGLLRVREFSQDDAHIFVMEDQIQEEYREIFEIVEKFYSIFNLEYSFRLGTRPEKFMGDLAIWDRAETALKEILDKSKKPYFVLDGDGAFYGPKIDILMKDSLGREWQMGTIQLDFQIPRRFNLTYVDNDGKKKTPVVIHRVIYGSLERFMGILIEHFAGAFPLWLAPVQVMVIPVSDKFVDYVQKVQAVLLERNVRVEINDKAESLGKRISEAGAQKIPYIIVVGQKEMENNTVAVRTRGGNKQDVLRLDQFASKVAEEIESKFVF